MPKGRSSKGVKTRLGYSYTCTRCDITKEFVTTKMRHTYQMLHNKFCDNTDKIVGGRVIVQHYDGRGREIESESLCYVEKKLN
jgi:hypothetical protein